MSENFKVLTHVERLDAEEAVLHAHLFDGNEWWPAPDAVDQSTEWHQTPRFKEHFKHLVQATRAMRVSHELPLRQVAELGPGTQFVAEHFPSLTVVRTIHESFAANNDVPRGDVSLSRVVLKSGRTALLQRRGREFHALYSRSVQWRIVSSVTGQKAAHPIDKPIDSDDSTITFEEATFMTRRPQHIEFDVGFRPEHSAVSWHIGSTTVNHLLNGFTLFGRVSQTRAYRIQPPLRDGDSDEHKRVRILLPKPVPGLSPSF